MNIKEKIGQRIKQERLAKGLTRKALEELTDDLKQSRIGNWEHGYRTPGTEEIKQLAKALDISAAYLMCLTDERQPNKNPKLRVLIPILSHQQACEPKKVIDSLREDQSKDNMKFVPISKILSSKIGDYAFALKMIDESMNPEFKVNDIQIVDPGTSPNPGDFVVVQISGKSDVIICQYKKLSFTSSEFALITLNDNWPNITVNENIRVQIIGKVVQNIRTYM